MDLIGPDILSRCMLPLEEHDHDVMARKLERPVLKPNQNFSPFLTSWFSIETPNPSYFDKDGNLKIKRDTVGYENPGKESNNTKNSEKRNSIAASEKLLINKRMICKKCTPPAERTMKKSIQL